MERSCHITFIFDSMLKVLESYSIRKMARYDLEVHKVSFARKISFEYLEICL